MSYFLLKITNPYNESLSVKSEIGDYYYSAGISIRFKNFILFYLIVSTILMLLPLLFLK